MGDTARHGHGHGKDTPSFEVGETARQFGIVIPLSYLCIVDGMARKKDTDTSKARQEKAVSLRHHDTARQFGIVNYHNQTAMKYHGKASQFTTWRCTTYNLELSYLCSTFVLLK